MRVFRLCKQIYSGTVLNGEGGLIVDGRWHSTARRVVYTASSEALAVLEVRVHLGRFVPNAAYAVHVVEVPDAQIQTFPSGASDESWNAVPPPGHARRIGDVWLRENATAALSVPSIHSATDRNILLNPAHPAAAGFIVVQVYPYRFDTRLFASPVRPRPRRRR